MPGTTARRKNSTSVQLHSNGAYTGDAVASQVVYDAAQIRGPQRGIGLYRRHRLLVAHLFAAESARAIGIA